jgi:ABC-2 type transport system ATP-binding protein
VIEIEGLRKIYRSRGKSRLALDGLDLRVEGGQIHGFLGPNGSGKTTTLRALLGLVRADAGTMRLFGQKVPDALPQAIGTVGAIVESPQFFGNFTARRTLRLLATAGGVKRKQVDEVLETVGLRDRAKERVKTYSLGMKQRLAVAMALLKSPHLLILDEPANGLDPAGIREMRDLLRSVGESGVTVLLSSHILSEVQQVCDTVSIISMGRRVMSGPVSDVLSRFDKGDVRVRVADLEGAAKLIRDHNLPVQVYDDHLVVSDLADPAWITETLAKRRMYVSELTPLVPNLENVFLNLTGTMPEAGVNRQVDDAYRPAHPNGLKVMAATAGAEAGASPEGASGQITEPAPEGATGTEPSGDPPPITAEPPEPEPGEAEPVVVGPDGDGPAARDGGSGVLGEKAGTTTDEEGAR